jgi:hypothetical protein
MIDIIIRVIPYLEDLKLVIQEAHPSGKRKSLDED